MGTFDRFLESLFPTGQQSRPTPTEPSAFQSSSGLLTDESGRPLTLPRGKPITRAALKKAYKRRPSFVDRLPWLSICPRQDLPAGGWCVRRHRGGSDADRNGGT